MSDSTIRSLFTTWGFRVDDKDLSKLDKSLDRLQSSVKYVGGLAIGAAAGIFGLAKSAADAGDEVRKASERLGIGVEDLQEYQYAAHLAGISNEEFQISIKKFGIALAEARNGSQEAKDKLKDLSKVIGYDVVHSGKKASDLLLDLSDGFAKTDDAGRKSAIAMNVFGRSGGKMVNLLNEGSEAIRKQRMEARDLGVVMSEKTARAAEEFHDILITAKAAVTGLRNIIAAGLFPVLTKLTRQFINYVKANRELIKVKVEDAIKILTDYLYRALGVFMRIYSIAEKLVTIFGGWKSVINFITSAMLALLALRFVAYMGNLVMVVGKAAAAFRLMGEAGLIAGLEAAAIPLALGAAFIGLILIIEDVVAYFQGRKSITGLILKNFDGLTDGLDKWIDDTLAKVQTFGEGIGKSIAEGLTKLDEADWKKIGDFVLKALKLALNLGETPFLIGYAIADGIIKGLTEGLQKKMPMLATMLGLNGGTPAASFGGIQADKGPNGEAPGFMDRMTAAMLNGGQGGESLSGIGIDAIVSAAKSLTSGVQIQNPGPAGVGSNPSYGMPNVSITSPITITVPEGTAPEQVAPAVRLGLSDALDSILRNSQRATQPSVQY